MSCERRALRGIQSSVLAGSGCVYALCTQSSELVARSSSGHCLVVPAGSALCEVWSAVGLCVRWPPTLSPVLPSLDLRRIMSFGRPAGWLSALFAPSSFIAHSPSLPRGLPLSLCVCLCMWGACCWPGSLAASVHAAAVGPPQPLHIDQSSTHYMPFYQCMQILATVSAIQQYSNITMNHH